MSTDNTDTSAATTSKRGLKGGITMAAPKRARKSAKNRLVIDDATTLADIDRLIAARTVEYGFAPTRGQVVHALVKLALVSIDASTTIAQP